MPTLRWIGILLAVLGIVLLFVPVPHSKWHGIKVGDASVGVTTQHDDKVPAAISVTLILAGCAVAATAGRRDT